MIDFRRIDEILRAFSDTRGALLASPSIVSRVGNGSNEPFHSIGIRSKLPSIPASAPTPLVGTEAVADKLNESALPVIGRNSGDVARRSLGFVSFQRSLAGSAIPNVVGEASAVSRLPASSATLISGDTPVAIHHEVSASIATATTSSATRKLPVSQPQQKPSGMRAVRHGLRFSMKTENLPPVSNIRPNSSDASADGSDQLLAATLPVTPAKSQDSGAGDASLAFKPIAPSLIGYRKSQKTSTVSVSNLGSCNGGNVSGEASSIQTNDSAPLEELRMMISGAGTNYAAISDKMASGVLADGSGNCAVKESGSDTGVGASSNILHAPSGDGFNQSNPSSFVVSGNGSGNSFNSVGVLTEANTDRKGDSVDNSVGASVDIVSRGISPPANGSSGTPEGALVASGAVTFGDPSTQASLSHNAHSEIVADSIDQRSSFACNVRNSSPVVADGLGASSFIRSDSSPNGLPSDVTSSSNGTEVGVEATASTQGKATPNLRSRLQGGLTSHRRQTLPADCRLLGSPLAARFSSVITRDYSPLLGDVCISNLKTGDLHRIVSDSLANPESCKPFFTDSFGHPFVAISSSEEMAIAPFLCTGSFAASVSYRNSQKWLVGENCTNNAYLIGHITPLCPALRKEMNQSGFNAQMVSHSKYSAASEWSVRLCNFVKICDTCKHTVSSKIDVANLTTVASYLDSCGIVEDVQAS